MAVGIPARLGITASVEAARFEPPLERDPLLARTPLDQIAERRVGVVVHPERPLALAHDQPR